MDRKLRCCIAVISVAFAHLDADSFSFVVIGACGAVFTLAACGRLRLLWPVNISGGSAKLVSSDGTELGKTGPLRAGRFFCCAAGTHVEFIDKTNQCCWKGAWDCKAVRVLWRNDEGA